MKTKKKRQATDSTMRNVRAANKRIKALEERVLKLELEYGMKNWPPIGPYPVTVRGLEKKRGKK